MVDEIWNVTKIYLIVSASLAYCYFISTKIPKGIVRLLFFLPIISLFLLLPLLLSSVFFQFFIGLFIGWFANFKLLLLAIYRDDHLPTDSSISLISFIMVTSLPIKMKQISSRNLETQEKHNLNSLLMFVVNLVLWLLVVSFYMEIQGNSLLKKLMFTARMFLTGQLVLTLIAVVVQPFLRYELEPQFVNPYLSTSIQNFWGKRWNQMSSSLLRSSIYLPTRSLLTPVVGRYWAVYPAIVTSFTVSGLMHEVFYFYVVRQRPTWEVLWFFSMNGVCVAIEIELKKRSSKIGWGLHPVISTPLTLGFLTITTTLWCWIELFLSGNDVREVEEYAHVVDYVKNKLYL